MGFLLGIGLFDGPWPGAILARPLQNFRKISIFLQDLTFEYFPRGMACPPGECEACLTTHLRWGFEFFIFPPGDTWSQKCYFSFEERLPRFRSSSQYYLPLCSLFRGNFAKRFKEFSHWNSIMENRLTQRAETKILSENVKVIMLRLDDDDGVESSKLS